jgi:hypothetical protein
MERHDNILDHRSRPSGTGEDNHDKRGNGDQNVFHG